MRPSGHSGHSRHSGHSVLSHSIDHHLVIEPVPKVPVPPSWVAWCERNSKPVERHLPRRTEKLTKWQKRGPMKKKDWQKFGVWASAKARPREPQQPKPEPLPCAAKYLPCGRKKKQETLDEMVEKMQALSTPRTITEKYRSPDHQPTYSPAIVWGRRAHREQGRPFKPPSIPACFAHDEIEGEFWAQLRFPVRPAALEAKIRPRTTTLAKPREFPPTPHCPIPPKALGPLDTPPPPRKKFTKKGWHHHKIRLLYLSKPISRPDPDCYFYS